MTAPVSSAAAWWLSSQLRKPTQMSEVTRDDLAVKYRPRGGGASVFAYRLLSPAEFDALLQREAPKRGWVNLEGIDPETLARHLYWLQIAQNAGDLSRTEEIDYALDTLDGLLAALSPAPEEAE